MTMRTKIKSWATAAGSLLLMVAIAAAGPQSPQPFVVALPSSRPIRTLDYLDATSATTLLVEAEIMEGLLGFDRSNDQNLEPRLAESWHQIDERTFVFRLRPGTLFQPHCHGAQRADAEQVTIEDVVFSLRRAQNSARGKEAGLDNLNSITPVSPDLLQIKLKRPDNDLPFQLATSIGHVTCRRYYESLGRDEASRKAAFAVRPIGTGPYRLTKPLIAGAPILLERYANYWDRQWVRADGTLDQIEYRHFDSSLAIVEKIKAGEIGMASLKLSVFGVGGLLDVWRSRPAFGGIARLQPPYLILVAFNLMSPELANPRLRRLLNAVVQRDKIEEICPVPKGSDLPSGYGAYIEIVDRFSAIAKDESRTLRQDPQLQELLRRLRTHGPLIVLAARGVDPIRDQILTSLAVDLKAELGLETKVELTESLAEEIASPTKHYDLVYAEWTPDTPGERLHGSILRPLFSSTSKANPSHYHAAQVDSLFADLRGVVDPATASRLYQEIGSQLLQDPPHIWLRSVRSSVIVYAKGYRGNLGTSVLIHYRSFLKDMRRIQ
jgi:ABC-type transport system substrate-binding protein